ncbi:MAG: hypothetical protein J6X34_08485, partial [Clostridia bacterium]|nr:hypothetical protein [Clostridia bacterium]
PRRKFKGGGYVITIAVILLLFLLLIAIIGWVSESAKRRTLERANSSRPEAASSVTYSADETIRLSSTTTVIASLEGNIKL